MMVGTLITEENADSFMPAVGNYALINSDVFIGVADDETDTACGVLAAEAVGDHTLAIRWILVEESMRRKGAGTELVSFLQGICREIEANAIVYSGIESAEKDDIKGLLLSCGFIEDEDSPVPVYSYKVSDMQMIESKLLKDQILSFEDLSVKDVTDMEEAWKDAGEFDAKLSEILRNREFYDKQYSFAAYDEKGTPLGILVCSVDGETIFVEDIYAGGKQPDRTGYALIKSLVEKAAGSKKDPVISVSYDNREMLFILDQVTGGKGEQTGEATLLTYFTDI